MYSAHATYPYPRPTTPFPTTTPANTINAQLEIVNQNPVAIFFGSSTCILSFPELCSNAQNPKDKPMQKLNIGPAKQAVVAIVERPFLDSVTFATRSWMEFPKARTVRPSTVDGILSETPNRPKRSTSLSAMESSHVAAIAKP